MAKKRMPRGTVHNSWCAHLIQALEDLGGEATTGEIFENLERSGNPVIKERIRQRKGWKSTATQMLGGNCDGTGHDVFQRVERGRYRLKGIPPVRVKLKDELEGMLRLFRGIPDLTLKSVEVESHVEEGKESVDVRYICSVNKG